MKKARVGIIGGTGYSGKELIRILMNHPGTELKMVTSRAHQGRPLRDYYPFLSPEMADLKFSDVDTKQIAHECDLVFFATPSGTARELAPGLYEKGVKIIDISGDFRLSSNEDYNKWYGYEHPRPDLLDKAVYCLPEINREEAKKADFISNPGCYPTSVLIPLIPVLEKIKFQGNILIDGKSGVSGAGKKVNETLMFCEVNESFKAYKSGGTHQHTPEMEKYVNRWTEHNSRVVFAPHLVPMERGILSSIYLTPVTENEAGEAVKNLKEKYRSEPFVRVFEGRTPATRDVAHTNQCHIGYAFDKRTDTLTVVSVIDNLIKGASGQAVQNMNLMLNLDERTGLC
jgi:N-acetyl-gamma-glutamyl-phosphate reductase